ncbi:MAG: ATP-binding protein [Candidatus Sungiibacteriota bacterium]
MTHPVSELAGIARDIAEGRRRDIPEHRQKDEIGELFGAVRYMDDSLNKSIAALERDINERKHVEETLRDSKKAILNLLEDLNRERDKLQISVKALEVAKEKAETEATNARKFQEAVEAAAEHIIITDAEGVILYANKAAEKITGYSRQDMLGKRPSLWGKQMEREFYEKMWKTIKDDKKPFHGEVKNKRKSGQEYIADVHIAPILDERGEVKFFAGIERDIAKEKALDRAKTEFVSLASHQLRTPLSAIKWIIEVLLEGGKLTRVQKGYLRDIYVSNERLINLVRDLLNVSKMEAGGIVVRLTPGTDLHEIVDAAVDIVKHRAEAKKVKIRVTCVGEPEAEIDPVLLSEAFRNILDNAVTFAPPKSVVDVNGKSNDGTCTIAVHNDGPAIPEPDREKIFTKFYRGVGVQRLKPEGSGLGLFIAKSAIEAMGGKIWFESGTEKGVTFFIQLPTKRR